MRQYYYYVTSLPKITYFDLRLPVRPADFLEEVKEILDPKDACILNALRYYFDNINLVNILENKKDEEFLPYGVFTKEELEAEIKDPQNIPAYMKNFLENKHYDERLHPDLTLENELILYYYDFLQTLPNDFLRKYVGFDFDLTNVRTAISTKKFKLDRKKHVLVFHELSEKLVGSNASDFGLIHDYDWLGRYIETTDKLNLYERELKLLEMKFKFLDDELTYDYFSLNQIISFFLKLFMLERKIKFDEAKGREIFDNITNDLSSEQNIFKDLNN